MSSTENGRVLIKTWGIGPDRPGIVFDVAALLKKHDASIVRLRSMQLADRFALTAIAAFSANAQARVAAALADLGDNPLGLDFPLSAIQIDSYDYSSGGVRYVFTFKGPDQEGIVEHIADQFKRRGLNLEGVTADTTIPVAHQPFTATPIFKSDFHTTVPARIDIDDLLRDLELAAREIDQDLTPTRLP